MNIDWLYKFPSAYWLDDREDEAVLDVLHNGSLFRHHRGNVPKYVIL